MQLCNGKPKLKVSHVYYAHVKVPMAITEIDEIEIIVYTEKSLYIENKFSKTEMEYTNIALLNNFIFEFMATEIFKET